ncbi:hypothetical protein BCV69DRAFT_280186 [Microstroma glucosiphilum]|uniref:Uncharacterized protein n=1 Tax=Pseudomicrostroma glucosiphilum TaxID=1684307 RepID=A0A316UGA2_9BASI|nr:hypothetical protein BCV69DRAFT_280186 [Pseudomicrostroma glucosiphilum]PWN24292.1 hypothetical protein BCV69DRAFT_280186 [Pseudomicrostroma glucosiphilum]
MSRSTRSQSSGGHGGYGAISQHDDDGVEQETIPATSTAPHPSMYSRPAVKATFAMGAILLGLNLFAFLFLITLLWHPTLPSPFATAPLIQTTLHLVAILVLGPALLVFELSSSVTKGIHEASLALVVILAILLAAIETFRDDGTALSATPALVLMALSLAWAVISAKVVASLHADYLVMPQNEMGESTPLRISVGSQDVQNQYIRWFKVAVASIGTLNVLVALLLIVGNVSLDGYDAGLETPGQLLWVNPGKSSRWQPAAPSGIIDSLSGPGRVRLHIGLEASPLPPAEVDSSEGQRTLSASSPWDDKPTAIFFPPSGVSGYTSSHWLRSMVHRAADKPATGAEDGHLALRRAVWFDPLGMGLSDYVRGSQDLGLQAAALAEGLEQLGLLDSAKSENSRTPREEQFVLVSLHDGALLSSVFASLLPSSKIHSQVFIDAETPTSYYSTDISADSGLRMGYGAEGRKTRLGQAWNDLLPSLASYLSPGRLLGALLLGQTSERRVMGSKDAQLRSSAITRVLSKTGERNPFASWYSWEHPAPSSKTLLARLTSHFEATHGVDSSNFARLNASAAREKRESLLRGKPLAVLSSFWKMGRDPKGWGEVQREQYVKLGMEGSLEEERELEGATIQQQQQQQQPLSSSAHAEGKRGSLVGWWKVGSRQTFKDGGDIGFPEGLCAEQAKGRVWCEESIRKVLSWEESQNKEEEKKAR